jgi:hypothetical protein
MPDLTTPLFVTAAFVLSFGLLVLGGTMGKLRTMLGAGRMAHRVEARSQIELPLRGVRAR